MKPLAPASSLRLCLALVAAVSAARSAEHDDLTPVFGGYMSIGSETRFVVRPVRGAAPMWVREGERVDDVFVSRFDWQAETLVLEVGGKHFELRLPAAQVRREPVPAEAVLTQAEALAIARREAERRDGWKRVSVVAQARRPSGSFQFALNHYGANTERRVIVVGPEGEVSEYRPLPPLPYRPSPAIFSEAFTVGVKRPFIWQKRVFQSVPAGEPSTRK